MKICKYCQRALNDKDEICPFCGYDPKTDTVSPNFVPDQLKNLKQNLKSIDNKIAGERKGIGPGVKKFAFIGLAIVVFSIFYKNSFNISAVVAEITHFFTRLKTGKITIGSFTKKDSKASKKIEWSSVNSFEGTQKAADDKNLVVEGIFFDDDSKSFVVIRGKVFSEGEKFGDITINKINKDSVEVSVDGQNKVVGINESIPR